MRVDLGAQAVSVGGEEVRLTRKEFELFAHLAQADGRVVTRDELRATVWRDSPVALTSRTVDVHVRRLRAIPELAELIITVRGTGYRVPAHRDVQVVG
ncbi:MAG: winged helix-turn-helix transcriptional regulator [Cellulomonadaceae bacterium]|nr:winged helix-turn-helix transcriptional regulator [Cellulomonadaceae bacterium]